MEQAMESPHALDGCNCRALVGKARFSYFIDVCNSCTVVATRRADFGVLSEAAWGESVMCECAVRELSLIHI